MNRRLILEITATVFISIIVFFFATNYLNKSFNEDNNFKYSIFVETKTLPFFNKSSTDFHPQLFIPVSSLYNLFVLCHPKGTNLSNYLNEIYSFPKLYEQLFIEGYKDSIINIVPLTSLVSENFEIIEITDDKRILLDASNTFVIEEIQKLINDRSKKILNLLILPRLDSLNLLINDYNNLDILLEIESAVTDTKKKICNSDNFNNHINSIRPLFEYENYKISKNDLEVQVIQNTTYQIYQMYNENFISSILIFIIIFLFIFVTIFQLRRI